MATVENDVEVVLSPLVLSAVRGVGSEIHGVARPSPLTSSEGR